MTDRTREFKERILAAVPIETYIGRYVALKKQGKYWKGLCPFHQEKTPSFTVTPDKGLYHCFGCGRGGDLFHFVMEMEGASFSEAMDILGKFAGIERPRGNTPVKKTREDFLLELNAKASTAFHDYLKSPNGQKYRSYLKDRGISDESVELYRLGAAPDEWRWLSGILQDRVNDALELGLLRESKGNRYDFFRDRIIFPILDTTGAVQGFGGRAMPGKDKEAKYINSSESSVFKKGKTLYGLYQGIREVRSRREAVIVEGYLDVIGLSQRGIGNALAPLGTALTEDHLKFLQRYTENLIFFMDGDLAGRQAALKFARLAVDYSNIKSSVVMLPTGMDPFDLSSQRDGEQIRVILENKIPSEMVLLMEVIYPNGFDGILKTVNHSGSPEEFAEFGRNYYTGNIEFPMKRDMTARRAGLEHLRAFVDGLNRDVDRELFFETGARLLGVSASSIKSESESSAKSAPIQRGDRYRGNEANVHDRRGPGNNIDKDPVIRTERVIVTEFLISPSLAAHYQKEMERFPFQDLHAETLWRVLEGRLLSGITWSSEDLKNFGLPAATVGKFAGILLQREDEEEIRSTLQDAPDPSEGIRDMLIQHQIKLMRRRMESLRREMEVVDEFRKEELTAEYFGLIGKLKDLEAKRKDG